MQRTVEKFLLRDSNLFEINSIYNHADLFSSWQLTFKIVIDKAIFQPQSVHSKMIIMRLAWFLMHYAISWQVVSLRSQWLKI